MSLAIMDMVEVIVAMFLTLGVMMLVSRAMMVLCEMVVVVGQWVVVVNARWMSVWVAVHERAVTVLVGVHLVLVGVSVSECRHPFDCTLAAGLRAVGPVATR